MSKMGNGGTKTMSVNVVPVSLLPLNKFGPLVQTTWPTLNMPVTYRSCRGSHQDMS